MSQEKRSRPLLLFYILVGYVCVQLVWWGVLIVQLNADISGLRGEILAMQGYQTLELAQFTEELHTKLTHRVWMVLGEGTVFLILLLLGFFKVRQTFRKEAALVRRQRNFLLSVTHELKTPLASVRLYLETLQKRTIDPEKTAEIVGNAIGQTDRLNALVDNILLATSFENRSYELLIEQGNLSEAIQRILHSSVATTSKHTLTTNIEPELHARFDFSALTSIVQNLLGNAVKYSDTGSEIAVHLRASDEGATLQICDQGNGIPPDQHKAIFDKFYRLGNEETRTTKGTGLGLFIVQELCDRMDVKVSVSSNSPKGSIFALHFPRP